jgi:hypothetical protein
VARRQIHMQVEQEQEGEHPQQPGEQLGRLQDGLAVVERRQVLALLMVARRLHTVRAVARRLHTVEQAGGRQMHMGRWPGEERLLLWGRPMDSRKQARRG